MDQRERDGSRGADDRHGDRQLRVRLGNPSLRSASSATPTNSTIWTMVTSTPVVKADIR
jgi:hypothetical protein